jgi:hypothetical protein
MRFRENNVEGLGARARLSDDTRLAPRTGALLAVVAVITTSLAAQADVGFNREAAVSALSNVNLQVCKPRGKKAKTVAAGDGHVVVTYAPNGRADRATVDTGVFAGTTVGTCIESVFKKTQVPPFDGTPVTVGKKFKLE